MPNIVQDKVAIVTGAGRGIGRAIAMLMAQEGAKVLVNDMPHTLAALQSGVLTESRAALIVTEAAHLSTADRRALDAELCAHQGGLAGLGISPSRMTGFMTSSGSSAGMADMSASV